MTSFIIYLSFSIALLRFFYFEVDVRLVGLLFAGESNLSIYACNFLSQ